MYENNKGIADKMSSVRLVPKYSALTKAEEDALITRAVRGEAQAMAEMHARYRGLIVSEAHASYLRNAALAADAENIAVLAFIEALHDYDPKHGAPFAGFVKARVHHALYTEFRRERRLWERTCHPEQGAEGATYGNAAAARRTWRSVRICASSCAGFCAASCTASPSVRRRF